jgi:ABC-type branched-subunit amino acid transport system permease subunit
VARSAERREAAKGWRGAVERVAGRVGWWPRLAIVGAVGALIPLVGLNDFQLQVGVNALLLAVLALGLNVGVGWGGLLEHAYIAFYGVGA